MLRRKEPVGLPEHDEQWGLTLGVLLGVYIVGSLFTSSLGRAGVVVLMCVLIVQIVQVEHVDQRLRIVNLVALALALLIGVAHVTTDHNVIDSVQALSLAVVATSGALAIVTRIARHDLITVRTVFGALDVYVLMGLAFAALYLAIEDWTGEMFTQDVPVNMATCFYYSVITLTTVGFGDLTPGSPLARSLTAVEALLGQIFLVTAVARFVSIMGQRRRGNAAGDQPQDQDDGG